MTMIYALVCGIGINSNDQEIGLVKNSNAASIMRPIQPSNGFGADTRLSANNADRQDYLVRSAGLPYQFWRPIEGLAPLIQDVPRLRRPDPDSTK